MSQISSQSTTAELPNQSQEQPTMVAPSPSRAVAVYCAASLGKQKAFQAAALCAFKLIFVVHTPCSNVLIFHISPFHRAALGDALATENRPLVYGGGNSGLMGIVSGAAAKSHGKVTGIIPYAIFAAGGEKDKGNGHATASTVSDVLDEKQRAEVCSDEVQLCPWTLTRVLRHLSRSRP